MKIDSLKMLLNYILRFTNYFSLTKISFYLKQLYLTALT